MDDIKTPVLETERLWLRPLRLEDAGQVQPLFACWEVVEFLNDKVPWPYPADGVESYYRDVALPAIARGEEWHWTLRRKEAPAEVIGAISLAHSAKETNRGFWLAAGWRGHGFMTEAVIAVNDFWFGELGYAALRASKAVGNEASRSISQKTGMRVVERSVKGYVSGLHETEMWQITAEEWKAWRAAHRESKSF